MERCDCKMLKFMAGVRWKDHPTNEVAERCGVLKLEKKHKALRLKWSVHVDRRDCRDFIEEVLAVEVAG